MKRDMDLVREILLKAEQHNDAIVPTFYTSANKLVTQGHLQMLVDAGYLAHVKSIAGGGYGWRLTWAGHEFIDEVRDEEIWRKTKEGAEKVGSWSIKLLGEIASGFVRAKAIEMGLPIV